MARCPACSGLIRAKSALRCPFCGVSLTASETQTAAETRQGSSPQDPLGVSLAIGEARFTPGHVFAERFRIVSLLGRGAMGEVYRADDLRLGQPVALKLLTDLGPQRRDALTRFTREVRLARTIAHPNGCRVFGALFMLVLLRVGLRRTWLAVFVLLLLNLPLTAWAWTPTAVLYALGSAGLFCVVLLRLGLLAGVAMLATERLLTSLPMTLDFDAWYIATSTLVLVLVLGLTVAAFRLTLSRGGQGVARIRPTSAWG